MSKGSTPRPRDVDDETYAKNWDAIFDKKSEPECPHCKGSGTDPRFPSLYCAHCAGSGLANCDDCPCLEMDETGCCKNCGCPILAS